MKWILALLSVLCLHAQQSVSVRVLMGINDRTPVRWDGSVDAQGGQITSIEPWRFEGTDSIANSMWKMSTHPIRLFGAAPAGGRQVVANGVIVHVAARSADATLRFQTAEGAFDVPLRDIPYGTMVNRLDGRVQVDRVAEPLRITETPDEEDFPSAAVDRKGDVWIAYSVFRHSGNHDGRRAPLRQPLTDFASLRVPTGGDQIVARHFVNGLWENPVAITQPGGDDYRTAIAIDGRDAGWVFWSQNVNNNFDVFGASVQNGRAGQPIRISTSPGSDIGVAAATDSNGKVWIAWQSWRNGRAAIFAASQQGAAFSAPIAISQSSGNEWNPAIAADRSGHVAVAWDSYRNGNYDVYARTLSADGSWGAELPIAVTARYEAYPSLAYDSTGLLWVAYEEGGAGWGKDFGAYQTDGVPVYEGRVVRVCAIESNGRRTEPAADVGGVLPGQARPRVELFGEQSRDEALDPKPQATSERRPSAAAPMALNPKNTSPRLVVDGSGRVWLAFRSAHPVWWNPIGTVWTEYVASLSGSQWTRPVFLTHTDNILDNRPALVAPRAGELLVIGSADHRREFHLASGNATNDSPAPERDLYNNDLYMNAVALAPAQGLPAMKPSQPLAAAPVSNAAETAAVRAMRDYRTTTPEPLRIARGEFHRHSEISMDGGNDGTLFDQWRYIIDAGALDWVGCCDHDNGGGREYSWWIEQKLTDIFNVPGRFAAMFNYERSVPYPEGHRNVIFTQRGIRPLPRLPRTTENQPGTAPDTQMLYQYLKFFGGIVASHTSATGMGTDWRDNDPQFEPLVEIYQGDRQNYEMPDAPRTISEKDAIGGWRPKGFVNLALEKGYVLAFEASSDHVSTHISYANLLVRDLTRDAVMDALRKRHVYAATDNILAEFRSGSHIMGDVFSTTSAPAFEIKLTGTAPFTKVQVVRNNEFVYSVEPKTRQVSFSWRDQSPLSGKRSYYYVRGEQENGELVWISPMWVTYTGR